MGFLVDFISNAILFFYEFTVTLGIPNYGIAIILFTISIKIVLLPLTIKQIKGMRVMQELAPQVQEIQKKHKSDPQKSQKMIMELYKKNNANPFSGCWPILLQMPILFAMFLSLREFFDYYQTPHDINFDHATFIWITDLGQPDTIILPFLVAAATFIQQKVTMSSATLEHPLQKTLLYVLPVFIGFISMTFPAALALYWAMYSVVGIFEQLILRRKKPVSLVPVVDEDKEDKVKDEESKVKDEEHKVGNDNEEDKPKKNKGKKGKNKEKKQREKNK